MCSKQRALCECTAWHTTTPSPDQPPTPLLTAPLRASPPHTQQNHTECWTAKGLEEAMLISETSPALGLHRHRGGAGQEPMENGHTAPRSPVPSWQHTSALKGVQGLLPLSFESVPFTHLTLCQRWLVVL